MDNNHPIRKSTRLQSHDYRTAGAYFVTICTQDRKQLLSDIIKTPENPTAVGEGLAPPQLSQGDLRVREGLIPPDYWVQLKPCGEIVREQLYLLEERFPSVEVSDYVIMPDHVHAIIILLAQEGGASPSPTLDEVICAFKSLTSRSCKQKLGVERIFQRSYADHICAR